MAGERRKYTRDCKEAAVAMAEREGQTVGQAARDLGINASMLARRRSEMRGARDGEPVRLRKRVAEPEDAAG
jgi:transposase-like protein